MKLRKLFLTFAFTGALGLGVWGLAVTFTAFGFADGDTLSATELNDLLNNNFTAAEDAINDLDGAVDDLDVAVDNLEVAVDNKFDKSGGSITGRTAISGPASSPGTGTASSVLYVNNTNTDSGSAAVFQSGNDSNNGAVSVKQQGTGPALSLKSNGGGPLISGAGALELTFVVEDTGTIMIGSGIQGGNPALTLDAEAGTVTNNVGSGLPLAFGSVNSAGIKLTGTDNWTVRTSPSGTTYYIDLDDVDYQVDDFVTVATTRGGNTARSITSSDIGGLGSGELALSPRNAAGDRVSDGFFFVVYQAGN